MGTPMDRTNRLFGDLSTFDEAFPELEDVIIEYTESGRFYSKSPRVHSVRSSGDLIHCSNTLCRQGGFEMASDIYGMIRDNVSDRKGYKICAGSEGSPKLRRVDRPCSNSINYKIKLVHKKK